MKLTRRKALNLGITGSGVLISSFALQENAQPALMSDCNEEHSLFGSHLQRMQLRRTIGQFQRLFNYFDGVSSPPAPPQVIDFWRQFDLHALIVDIATEVPLYRSVQSRAMAYGFRIYPAGAVRPQQIDDYFQQVFWEVRATTLRTLAGLRISGDPWIGMDMENTGRDKVEPSLEYILSAAAIRQNHTVENLHRAMQPFLEVLQETGVSMALYPASPESGEDLLYIAESLGRERMEFWTETTYGNAVAYRESPERSWPALAASFLNLSAVLQTRVPGAVVRPGIRDLERQWSRVYRADLRRGGAVAPWAFDFTRHDSAHFGSADYLNGTAPSGSTNPITSLNDVRHVWPMPPLGVSVPAAWNTPVLSANGLPSALPISLGAVFGTATGLSSPPQKVELHPDGIPCRTTSAGIWNGLRAAVLPTDPAAAFTLDATFRLPQGGTLAAGVTEYVPIMGAVSQGARDWQVYYERTGSGTGFIRLFINQGTVPVRPLELAVGVIPGQEIRVLIGRQGNEWLYRSSAGAFVTMAVPRAASINYYDQLLIGAGIIHTALTGPGLSTYPLIGCPGLILVKTWAFYTRMLNSQERTYLQASASTGWPYGYGI
jgi:hypothetical protein